MVESSNISNEDGIVLVMSTMLVSIVDPTNIVAKEGREWGILPPSHRFKFKNASPLCRLYVLSQTQSSQPSSLAGWKETQA